jgi:diguanylate cyclase (GGDEF)-like protein
MFFGGTNGFNTFLPNEVELNRYEAPVRLVAFSKFNQAIPLHKAFNKNGILELNYSDSVFGFEFAALDYTKPSDNLYQYKMEGMHDKWLTTNGSNRISFFNLSDGQYKFRVKGANNDAHWSKQELMIEINILPPPWKTWWAYTFYTIACFLLVLTFIRAQRKNVIFERRQNIQLENKVNERTLSLQQANLKLEEISLTDQLTGLKNRHFLLNNLEKDIALVLRKYHEKSLNSTKDVVNESDLIFFLIDLDHFKQVNDLHGHTAGDAVLVQIKSILEQVFRETDYLVRWGGEEFLVVARFSDREKAPELAERLRQSVEEHDFDIGQGIILKKTCSIGFASFPFITDKPDYLSWERVVDIADHCLYSAKKSTRNAWVGLENLDCDEDGLIEIITTETKTLLDANRLKATTSLSNVEQIKWN